MNAFSIFSKYMNQLSIFILFYRKDNTFIGNVKDRNLF
jgi:hypothetical protein